MPINVQDFIIQPEPVKESVGLVRLGETMQRNREWQYRLKKEQEADQWRKLNLIQELTDLSKHQTGSDVANSVGNKLMSDVYQKYTTNADKMSPIELQANIQRDMSGIVNGMDMMKNELANADKQVATLKQTYPGLDVGTLYDNVRKDIVHRRLNDSANGFRNEMEIKPSELNLSDPNVLSKYVTTDKDLRNYFTNPQGLDVTDVFTGNRNNYTKYSAKIPIYKRPSFSQQDVHEGFLKKGQPTLTFKSSTLPSDSLPSSKGQPFEMIDKDVFDAMGGQEKLQLIHNTRAQVPNYDNLNPTEQEYAQRHVYLKTAKALDQLDFHPTEIKTPSASMLKLQMGLGGNGNSDNALMRDVYKEVKDKVELVQGRKTPLNELSATAQKILLKYANELTGSSGTSALGQGDIYVAKAANGDLSIFNAEDGKLIAPIDFGDVNLPAQPGIKEKREVLKKSNQQVKKDPLGILD